MDLVGLAEEIAAAHLRTVDPTDGVVQEAAEENDAQNTWAIFFRPQGDWFYFLQYIPEEGWSLFRVLRRRIEEKDARPITKDDISGLGIYQSRVQAMALASNFLEDQP